MWWGFTIKAMKKKVNDAEEKRGRGAVIAANFKSRGGKDVLARKCEELKEEETWGEKVEKRLVQWGHQSTIYFTKMQHVGREYYDFMWFNLSLT